VPDELSFLLKHMPHFTYVGMFLFLVVSGFGLPIPEEAPLVFGGYLVYTGRAELGKMIIVCYVGIVLGDFICYGMGRYLGSRVIRAPFFRSIFTAERRAKIERWMERYGAMTIFFCRFLSALRATSFFSAGTMGMNPLRFLLADGIAACISVPLLVILGNAFGEEVEKALAIVARVRHVLLILTFAGIAAGVVFLLYMRRRWRGEGTAQ